jgi:hypothetical protein
MFYTSINYLKVQYFGLFGCNFILNSSTTGHALHVGSSAAHFLKAGNFLHSVRFRRRPVDCGRGRFQKWFCLIWQIIERAAIWRCIQIHFRPVKASWARWFIYYYCWNPVGTVRGSKTVLHI